MVLERPRAGTGPADLRQACGARVDLAHPLGARCSATSGPETDAREATNLAELLGMGRLPEAWLAPPQVRELRELVPSRAKLVALRSGPKAHVHAVLANEGGRVPMSDLFGVAGSRLLDQLRLGRAYACGSPGWGGCWPPTTRRSRCWAGDFSRLAGDVGYPAIQAIPRGASAGGRLGRRDR